MSLHLPEGKILIQFDGICILCNATIQLILKADRQKKFLFQTIQSTLGNDESGESVIVNDGNKQYTHFDAVMKIGKELGGIYRLVAIFRLLPKRWRHRIYLWIANNRYRWFGKRDTCYIPSAEEKDRFI